MRNRGFSHYHPCLVIFAFVAIVGAIVIPMLVRVLRRDEATVTRAEALLAEGQPGEAIPLLVPIVRAKPALRRARLVLVRARIAVGDGAAALEEYKPLRALPAEDRLDAEVRAHVARVDAAFDCVARAEALLTEGRVRESIPAYDAAAAQFPESVDLAIRRLTVRGVVAFAEGDYDRYLALARVAERLRPADPRHLATVASALAAVWAAGGAPGRHAEAQALLQRAEDACRTPAERAEFAEFRERIEHRLRTKELLDKAQYDAKYRRQG